MSNSTALLQQIDGDIKKLSAHPAAVQFLQDVRPYVADGLRLKGTAREALRHFENLLATYVDNYPDNEGLQKLRDVGLPTVRRQLEASL